GKINMVAVPRRRARRNLRRAAWFPLRSPRKRRVGKIGQKIGQEGSRDPAPQLGRGSRVGTLFARALSATTIARADRTLSFLRVRRPRLVSPSVPPLPRAPSSRPHGRRA